MLLSQNQMSAQVYQSDLQNLVVHYAYWKQEEKKKKISEHNR